ncbi:hypothetical protein [Saccharibacillus alkalitolerans]|uniref:Uncharacterized protein n=1 Tax=Saccharibacillus alkalitolerans TaxID=2705290 RepID=A0ABX0FC79_9BACL|nr:hypothetical protein [Saccharibacillus alkalitolerans]NGZ75657.1 hypothetical protein [Saccharibacillus alkalitolerans]
MKKVIIGSVLTLAGTWITGCIFVAAALFVPNLSSWEGTRVWYAIFGSGPYEADLKQSMALGLPFAVGVLMFAFGIVILAVEFFRPEERRGSAPAPIRPLPGGNGGTKLAAFSSDKAPLTETEEIPTMKEVGP